MIERTDCSTCGRRQVSFDESCDTCFRGFCPVFFALRKPPHPVVAVVEDLIAWARQLFAG